MDYGGEDAYFVSSVGGGALGVADGVGGWADSGVNPAGVAQEGRQTDRQMDRQTNRRTDSKQATKQMDGLGGLKGRR
jgi:serine/threonine protein phosphatase PrpC